MSDEIRPPEIVRVVVRRHPLREEKTTVEVPACGRTLAELLELAGVPVAVAGRTRLDGVRVPRDLWTSTVPSAGQLVTSSVVPAGGGGGKDSFWRYARWFPPMWSAYAFNVVAPHALGYGTGWSPVFDNPSGPSFSSGRAKPFITGTRNEQRQWQPVPQLFGYRVRYRPPYAARPYSSWQGAKQRWHCLMTFGHGPLRLEDLRFGDTPIDALKLTAVGPGATATQLANAQIQVREGWSDGNEATLAYYLDQVQEEPLQISVVYDDLDGNRAPWSVRRTEPNVSRIGVEVFFPQGLIDLSGSNPAKLAVEVEVFYAPAGTTMPSNGNLSATGSGWTAARGRKEDGTRNTYDGIKANEQRKNPFVAGIDWDVATAGQFDVALRRKTADRTVLGKIDISLWSMLRTYRLSNPLNITGLCTVSFDIVATGNLTGELDSFNARASWMGPYYDSGSAAWVTPTRTSTPTLAKSGQPAAHYRHVLQGAANRAAVADGRIDLARLAAWAVACETAGLHFGGVFDTPGTVFERLRSIAAIGRASPHMTDGKFTVATDLAAPGAATEKFTPREYSNFQGDLSFPERIHALYVEWANPDIEGLDRITVYDDGYNLEGTGGNTAASLFDALTLIYVTDKDEAWKHGRRALAERRLRNQTYSLDVVDAHLSSSRGDCVELGIEAIDTVLKWGRVKSVTQVAGAATAITFDEALTFDGVSSYLFRFRKASGETLDRSIGTPAAATDTIAATFAVAIPAGDPQPVAGDLFIFGKSTTDFRRVIIRSIEHRSEAVARVACVDEAPAVYTADTSTPVAAATVASNPPPASASGANGTLVVTSNPPPTTTTNGTAGIVVSTVVSGASSHQGSSSAAGMR